ncbi:MAG: hypothetical protein R3B91_09520 [Planctomycetaceae bacterium]
MRQSSLYVLLAFLAAFMCAALESRGDELVTIDGETLAGKVNSVAEGQVSIDVTKDEASESQSLSLSDLRSIRLIPELFDEDDKTELLVDNRRTDEHKASEEHEASAKIKLRKGHHAFTLVYWQKDEPAKLSIEVAGPGGEFGAITPEVLFRVNESVEIEPSAGNDDEGFRLSSKGEGFEAGVHYEIRDLGDHSITSLAELRGVTQNSSGGHRMLDLSMKHPDRDFAVILRGYFSIQEDGEYGAKLKSTGNSQLFVGPTPDSVDALDRGEVRRSVAGPLS